MAASTLEVKHRTLQTDSLVTHGLLRKSDLRPVRVERYHACTAYLRDQISSLPSRLLLSSIPGLEQCSVDEQFHSVGILAVIWPVNSLL